MRKQTTTALESKFVDRTAHVAVIGLGYVGLPQAITIAEAGFSVTGIDVNAERVTSLCLGRSYVADVASRRVRAAIRDGRFSAQSTFAALPEADVITISVPTPLSKTKDPDVSHIRAATAAVAQAVRPGQLVVLESTTYPGTTEEVVRPALESSGLKVGKDIFLAFSPERIDPGARRYTLSNTPKLVAGITPQCTRLARSFYRQFVERVVPLSSPQTAEMAKLLENTFRNVNIALVNELAMMCDVLGIDVYEVIEAAATKPFGYTPFYPGPGLGGHCIPVDPEYLAWKLKALDFTARFIGLAGEINAHMPSVVVGKVADALNAMGKSINGARILALGVTYKADVADTRESPALAVLSLLQARGAKVAFHDPYVSRIEINDGAALESIDLTPDVLARHDCAIILANHRGFHIPSIAAHSQLLVDTRNATSRLRAFRDKIVRLGAPSPLLHGLGVKGRAA
jgi:UDP-N-acetyl-D-glucosamine dehydrogenase